MCDDLVGNPAHNPLAFLWHTGLCHSIRLFSSLWFFFLAFTSFSSSSFSCQILSFSPTLSSFLNFSSLSSRRQRPLPRLQTNKTSVSNCIMRRLGTRRGRRELSRSGSTGRSIVEEQSALRVVGRAMQKECGGGDGKEDARSRAIRGCGRRAHGCGECNVLSARLGSWQPHHLT